MNWVEMALVALDWLAGCLGFALVPVGEAEGLADVRFPCRLVEGRES